MSQHDYDVANGSGSSVRADLNSLAGAIQSQNSGSNAPTATAAGMVWYDTTNQAMKQRNSANSAWQSQAESIAGGHLAGHRNRIINGAMKIDQRNSGATQTFTAGAALAYSVDRWYGYCTGANITGARITSSAQNRYRFTGATSNTGVGFGQRIEAANSMDLAGRTCTLSVKLSSSSLTSITWTAYYANTADTFGTLASPTRTQIATGSFSISSTEATYSAQINVSASATTGIEIVFTGGALLGSQTLTIGDVQFEPGGVATPFEVRMIGNELLLCQRYYWTTGVAINHFGVQGYSGTAGSGVSCPLRYPVTMRDLPTVTFGAQNLLNTTGLVANSITISGYLILAASLAIGSVSALLNNSEATHSAEL
jgi:hypothetical protein